MAFQDDNDHNGNNENNNNKNNKKMYSRFIEVCPAELRRVAPCK